MQGGNEATLGLYRVPLLLILTHETCRLNTRKQKNKIEKKTTTNETKQKHKQKQQQQKTIQNNSSIT